MVPEIKDVISSKILLMGSAQAGKTTIKEVVFGGKDPRRLKTKSTIGFNTQLKQLADDRFAIWDTGGQKTYLEAFIGPMSKSIFSNVLALVWIVDIAAEDMLSRSKYYFDLALDHLHSYSPEAKVFCFLHKVDLRPDCQKSSIKIEDLVTLFRNARFPETHFHTTSIFDKTIYIAMAEVLSNAVMDKAASWKDDLYEFVDEEISGVSIFTEDGLPLLQKGDMQDIVLISANLWLSTAERIVGELDTADKMDAQLVLSEKYVFIFKHLEKSLLLAAVAKKTSPLEYVVVRTTALAEQLNKALRGTEGLNLLPT